MSETFKQLQKYLDKQNAISLALTLLEWDLETLAPKKSVEHTSKAVGILAAEEYEAIINDDVRELLHRFDEESEYEQLSVVEKKIIKELRKRYEQLEKIPVKEYQEYQELLAKASSIWTKAKEEDCFELFEEMLEKIFEYAMKFGNYCKKDRESAYDRALMDYEECFTTKHLDQFFEELKACIVPLLRKVNEKKDFVKDDFLYQYYDPKKQEEFCNFLAKYIGFDFDKGVIAKSSHPFTTNLHNNDVRITNHFYENNLASAIFSVIHEGGHALYEMGIADEYTMTLVGGGTSMGMHESQSRMYENMIGRSLEFWTPIYGKLQETFMEQLKEVSLEQFVRAINKAQSSLIRTEADELSYCLHVIIRYEIEKDIFDGKIRIKDLPQIWNQKYKEYLGIAPENDRVGVLQDIHWACGNIGYFPSYALGNAIAAQMYATMKQAIPVEELLKQGDLIQIRQYLGEQVHQFGKTKNTDEILMDMTGESLNPKYYTDYLYEKYTKLYEL